MAGGRFAARTAAQRQELSTWRQFQAPWLPSCREATSTSTQRALPRQDTRWRLLSAEKSAGQKKMHPARRRGPDRAAQRLGPPSEHYGGAETMVSANVGFQKCRRDIAVPARPAEAQSNTRGH